MPSIAVVRGPGLSSYPSIAPWRIVTIMKVWGRARWTIGYVYGANDVPWEASYKNIDLPWSLGAKADSLMYMICYCVMLSVFSAISFTEEHTDAELYVPSGLL